MERHEILIKQSGVPVYPSASMDVHVCTQTRTYSTSEHLMHLHVLLSTSARVKNKQQQQHTHSSDSVFTYFGVAGFLKVENR